ncbi:MAG: hypothetical protein LBP31_00985 [Holosporales bacterium]|nr:hypothetical protein [Holosporales bacterium]
MKEKEGNGRSSLEVAVLKVLAKALLLILFGIGVGQGTESKWKDWTKVNGVTPPMALQLALNELIGDWGKLRRS